MSLKPLLEKQIIRIDDHNRGNREIKDWDDPKRDVHIDKRTKYGIEGKTQHITIRIPINSDREVAVEINGNHDSKMPNKLRREIQQVLKDNKQRAGAFAKEIIKELNNYSSILSSEEKVEKALNRLSKHFDLEWTSDKIATYINGNLTAYTQIYRDRSSKAFFFTLNSEFLELSDITGWSRHEIWLNRFK